MPSFFETSIEYLKGVGPQRAELLKKELHIYTYGDLLRHYPFRYEDRTRVYRISELHEELPNVQVRGKITGKKVIPGKGRRLVATLDDGTGQLELVWFQGISWADDKVKPGVEYMVVGKPTLYGRKLNMAHPEMELAAEATPNNTFQPIYPLTEKLRRRYVDSKAISRWMREVLNHSKGRIRESLTPALIQKYKLQDRESAIRNAHFPESQALLDKALRRLKFEELFFIQLRLLNMKILRQEKFKGLVFADATLVTEFYKQYLPFELTAAQKKVIHEIYGDLRSGKQMNRLLQGDVGSGKTVVAFICMLIVIGGGAQCALMAPTEILAQQHYHTLHTYAEKMGLFVALLTGSTKRSERTKIKTALEAGALNILVGTHAVIEENVQFKNLGLAVIDEQHRFGVAQRSRLWEKNEDIRPHVLVMTATPIPRTLAMTLYGDLDVSVIDELPRGRKPVRTIHRFDSHRLEVNRFLSDQMKAGRQVYEVYPLIEESEKLDLKHLMDGFESISRAFPDVAISILHGKMKPEAKEFEMNRFVRGETKILVSTTVIEVGVDVPNASVMVIENAERFGLSQLHQLRGRVGRGAEQSYCILITGYKLTADSKLRIETMVHTTDGFKIAEMDLKLRGPGDLAGTQQSGLLDLHIADLSKDQDLLLLARKAAETVVTQLDDPSNKVIKSQLLLEEREGLSWSRIS